MRAIAGTASDVANVWTLVFIASDEASVRTIVGTASDVASVWTLVFTASPLVGTDSDLADSADVPTPRSPWAGFSVRLKGLGHLRVRALFAVFHASTRALARDLRYLSRPLLRRWYS